MTIGEWREGQATTRRPDVTEPVLRRCRRHGEDGARRRHELRQVFEDVAWCLANNRHLINTSFTFIFLHGKGIKLRRGELLHIGDKEWEGQWDLYVN